MTTQLRIRRWLQRRPQLTVWGDARALPFTEGQAVVARGQIGPAHAGLDASTPLR